MPDWQQIYSLRFIIMISYFGWAMAGQGLAGEVWRGVEERGCERRGWVRGVEGMGKERKEEEEERRGDGRE